MGRITSGISQTGGKYRMVNTLLKYTPYHGFFLSLFLGAGHYELNKPRCRYECLNDAESEIINYILVISGYNGIQDFTSNPSKFSYDEQQIAMFEEMKQGVLGLVSQEICNRIANGKVQPKNDVERAYFFYYLNKLTYGGSIWKVRKNPPCALEPKALKNVSDKETEDIKIQFKGLQPDGLQVRQTDVKKAKEEFEVKTKGYRGITVPSISKNNAKYRGVTLPTVCKEKSVDEAKSNYKSITPKASFAGINNTRALGNSANKRDLQQWRKEFNPAYKGINPKTTRPYENNDCGLLTPIDPEAIKRLRYVNLTAYDFRKVYEMFYQAFHIRKGLGIECLIFEDPPYPGTEKYYGDLFPTELHQELIDINLKSPFNIMQTIGGECEFYLKAYKKAKWNIVPVKVKYSTDANSQKESQEYICMNYNIKKVAPMIFDHTQQLIKRYIYD